VATTWNPSDKSANITLSGGNLVAQGTNGSDGGVRATISLTSGKAYFEVTWLSATGGVDAGCGIATSAAVLSSMGSTALGIALVYQSGAIYVNGTNTGINIGTNTAPLCIAVDLVNSRIWFRIGGGNWNNSGTANPATNAGGINISALFPTNAAYAAVTTQNSTNTYTANFGASAFTQTVPSGFISWDVATAPPAITPPAIRIKHRAAGGAAGAPASLANGELAYNEQDDTLYYGKGDSGAGVATSIVAIGGTLAAGGGAPVGAEYITSTSDATLTSERVLTDTATVTWDRTTAGQIKANTAGGGGNVSNSGTPTVNQWAVWVTSTTIKGVTNLSGPYTGVATNSSAAAGEIGECMEQTRAYGSPLALSAGVTANVTASPLALTAGDWDICGNVSIELGGSGSVSQLTMSISTTSATFNNVTGFRTASSAPNTGSTLSCTLPPVRVSLSGSQNYYLVANLSAAVVSTISCYGIIHARRVR